MILPAVALLVLATLAGHTGASALTAQGQPQCRNLRYRSNFRLNSAQQYLTNAERQGIPASDQRRHLNNALRNLGDAVAAGDADQLTLWYMFGKAHAMNGDLAGADTAWTRAEAAAGSARDADCVGEIQRLRRNERVPLVNGAVAMLAEQNNDSALALLRRAAVIYRGDPTTFLQIASIFYNQERIDSAVRYFRLAARTGDDPQQDNIRANAAFNAARLLQAASRFADAEAAYREYLRMRPRDMAARAGLAAALQGQGMAGEALAIYDSVLTNADSLESFELFESGVALFRQAQADTADAALRGRKLQMAARAFELGLQKNPLFRDAIFNLANVYLVANDTVNAARAARRLIEVDPYHRRPIEMLAETYRLRAQPLRRRFEALAARRDSVAAARDVRGRYTALQDTLVQLIQRRDSLPLEVNILRFEPRDSTAAIRGGVQNLLPPERAAFTLTIEFVSARGETVATERVEVPALNAAGSPGSSYDFNLQAAGRGIVAYRYRVGG